MGDLRLLISEGRLHTLLLFRSAVAAFFTLAMPLMFLLMVNFFLSGTETEGGVGVSQHVTAALAVFGMVTATFTNLAINTAMARDQGILKRVAGTPMPMSVHLGGRILSATLVGVVSVTLMLTAGWLAFDVEIIWSQIPVFAVLLLFGAATFSALGLAVAAMTPTARAAPAIANGVILPLAFISGVFFPMDNAPSWLQALAGLLPLEPLASAAIAAFTGVRDAAPVGAVVSLLIWGGIGVAVALRFFSYEPSESGSRRSGASVSG